MDYLQSIIHEYFIKNPIDVEQIKVNYLEKSKVKLVDEKTACAFTLGVDASKLYIEKLKIK